MTDEAINVKSGNCQVPL